MLRPTVLCYTLSRYVWPSRSEKVWSDAWEVQAWRKGRSQKKVSDSNLVLVCSIKIFTATHSFCSSWNLKQWEEVHRALLVNNAAVTYGKDKYPQHPHKHTHRAQNHAMSYWPVHRCLENVFGKSGESVYRSTGHAFILQTCFFGLRVEALFDSALTGRTMAEIGESVVTLRPTK